MTNFESQNIPYLSQETLESIKFSAEAHKDQVRIKGGPFISHPVAVGLILSRAGFPDKVVMAGFLHDVIEDTKYTYEDIKSRFGEGVANLVRWVTYDQDLPTDEGKIIYRKQLSEGPVEACAISAADLLANRTDTLHALQNGVDWHGDGAKMIEYDTKRLKIIKQRLNHQLVQEVEAIIEQAHQFFNK